MAQGNRIYVNTATAGTGTVTLGAVKSAQFCTFAEAGLTDGQTIRSYILEEGTDFEIGYGVYNSAGPTLTRATVRLSRIGGVAGTTKMTLAGTATVRVIAAKEDLVLQDESGNVAITGTLDSAGNFSVATNKLTVAAASGNTAIAGTLAVTGALTLSAVGLIYDAKTLTGSTGTGNMVLSASPTFTGTIVAASLTNSGLITANAGVLAAPNGTYNPTSTPDNAALVLSGSFGGGITIKDSTGRIGFWSSSNGAQLNIGVGGTTSGITGQIAITSSLVTTVALTSTGNVTGVAFVASGGTVVSASGISGNYSGWSMEIGASGSSNTPFIDFHSSASANDYDTRIIASGGTASSGQGTLTLTTGTLAITANATISGNFGLGDNAASSALKVGTLGHIIGRQTSDGSMLIGGGQASILINSGNPLSVLNTTASTTNSTGALVVAGGVGIGGNCILAPAKVLGLNTAGGGVASNNNSVAVDTDAGPNLIGSGLIWYSDISAGGCLVGFDNGTATYGIIFQLGTSFQVTDPGSGANKWWVQSGGKIRNRFTSGHALDYVVLSARGLTPF